MKIFREAKGLPEPEEEKKDSVVEDKQEDSKQEENLKEAKAEELRQWRRKPREAKEYCGKFQQLRKRFFRSICRRC